MGPEGADRRQLRFALSMNGGVSLCVWIGGAVAEIDEMRRGGEGFWGDLLEAADYQRAAQVDVMAGASAGGLNAVMLASAIQANRPFHEFFPLWLEAADIEELVKPPSDASKYDRRAVLDGRYFLHRLHDALEQAERRKSGDAPTQALAVFASATLVRGNAVALRDLPGAPIAESRSDAYFHVARRGSAARGLDGFTDGEGVVDNLTALASIGRATSSLPGLFEPVTFDRATFGSRLVGAFRADRPTVQIMDGGVVDNVPIGRAIRAVSHIPATGRTRRVLLYLHPDPGGDGSMPTTAPDEPRTVVEVARSFSGKRSETIREDIDLLRTHNDAVARRDAQARVALERVIGGSDTTNASVSGHVRAMIAAQLLRAAVDPSSELLWHAPNRPRVASLLDAPADTCSKDDLAREFRNAVDSNPNVLVADRVHRTVSALQRVTRMAMKESSKVDVGGFMHHLNELQLLCHLVTSFQLGITLEGPPTTDAAAVTRRLDGSYHELAAFTVPNGVGDQVWRGLANWQLPDPRSGGRTLLGEMEQMLAHALSLLEAPEGDGLGCRVLNWLHRQPHRAAAARDIADSLLALRAEPVASDQHIDFVRIAGNVETPASIRFVGPNPDANRRRYGDRIAGKQLHHLGAFFDRRWRANDLRWGRLDSVPALVDAVLDDDALTALRTRNPLLPDHLRLPTATRDDIRTWLIAQRQDQLLAEFEREEPFERWATLDRRLASLLGGRRLTSTAIKAAITTTRVVAVGQPPLRRAALVVLRPILLALAGVLLAGRWATAAIAWSLCVLAASRQGGANERWAWWYAGAVLCLVVAAVVEFGVKPIRPWPRVAPPYLLALAGLATGLWFALHNEWLSSSVGSDGVPWVWVVPAGAAGFAALSLFFWMSAPAAVAMSILAAGWYGWIAYVAVDPDAVKPWPVDWPFHSMWLAWLVAILGLPVLIGRLPARWLGPAGSTT